MEIFIVYIYYNTYFFQMSTAILVSGVFLYTKVARAGAGRLEKSGMI